MNHHHHGESRHARPSRSPLHARAGGLLGLPSARATSGRAIRRAEEWPTYGGNLARQRYSALDQIDKDNFKDLQSHGA